MKYHVLDDHCNIIGGEDHGAVDTAEEAAQAINEQIASGHKGGCRCSGSGWRVLTCEELQKHLESTQDKYWFISIPDKHECKPYRELSMSDEMAKFDTADRKNRKKINVRKVEGKPADVWNLYDFWDKEK